LGDVDLDSVAQDEVGEALCLACGLGVLELLADPLMVAALRL